MIILFKKNLNKTMILDFVSGLFQKSEIILSLRELFIHLFQRMFFFNNLIILGG